MKSTLVRYRASDIIIPLGLGGSAPSWARQQEAGVTPDHPTAAQPVQPDQSRPNLIRPPMREGWWNVCSAQSGLKGRRVEWIQYRSPEDGAKPDQVLEEIKTWSVAPLSWNA